VEYIPFFVGFVEIAKQRVAKVYFLITLCLVTQKIVGK